MKISFAFLIAAFFCTTSPPVEAVWSSVRRLLPKTAKATTAAAAAGAGTKAAPPSSIEEMVMRTLLPRRSSVVPAVEDRLSSLLAPLALMFQKHVVPYGSLVPKSLKHQLEQMVQDDTLILRCMTLYGSFACPSVTRQTMSTTLINGIHLSDRQREYVDTILHHLQHVARLVLSTFLVEIMAVTAWDVLSSTQYCAPWTSKVLLGLSVLPQTYKTAAWMFFARNRVLGTLVDQGLGRVASGLLVRPATTVAVLFLALKEQNILSSFLGPQARPLLPALLLGAVASLEVGQTLWSLKRTSKKHCFETIAAELLASYLTSMESSTADEDDDAYPLQYHHSNPFSGETASLCMSSEELDLFYSVEETVTIYAMEEVEKEVTQDEAEEQVVAAQDEVVVDDKKSFEVVPSEPEGEDEAHNSNVQVSVQTHPQYEEEGEDKPTTSTTTVWQTLHSFVQKHPIAIEYVQEDDGLVGIL